MNIPTSRGIYAITDCDKLSAEELIKNTEKILNTGVSLFQYRNKSSAEGNEKELALALQALCKQYKTPFIVNDNLALAKEIAADGIHLGRDDVDISEARAKLGTKIIGVSCYNDLDRAITAEAAGADYIAFGSFFPSKTKPNAKQADLETLLKAKSLIQIPIVAIGGITPENGQLLVDAQADFLAVISGLFLAPNSIEVTTKYKNLFK